MTDENHKAPALIEITIDGDISERDKQLIRLGVINLHMTLMLPYALKQDAFTTDDQRSAAYVLALTGVRMVIGRTFPDIKIDIHDPNIKDPVGLKAP